jgi:ABC-type glycerol-3-phosphate transport system substrate-binding protein
MTWAHSIACFFAGTFFANAVPHFIHGISGDPFPTPFAKPPGKGLSSPTVNVFWALFNMVIGWLLFRTGRISADNYLSLGLFFSGIALMAIMGSLSFSSKHEK